MEKTALENIIPTKASIQQKQRLWIPAFVGMTGIFFTIISSPAFAIAVSVGTNPTPAFPKTKFQQKEVVNSKDPVILTAQEMNYDKENSIVSANGNVEVVQGETMMLADLVIYDQIKNIVYAKGNVSVLEPSGNVYFANNVELKDDLKSGVIQQFKARLSDNSLFVASTAKKPTESITELQNAVYSPCKVCIRTEGAKEDADSPLWQMRSEHITINQEQQEVEYKNAFMEIYGIPILYTPYFSHPTPDADNQTGLLSPEFKQSTNLGTVYKQAIYYAIAPDKDATFTPIFTTLEGPVLAAQYRQLFDNGSLLLDGSITKPQTRDASGVTNTAQSWRGHLDAKGDFHYDEKTDWGFNIRRTSDDTYLRRYDFSQDSLLTSRIYGEKHDFINDGGRSFASVQALKFDGLTAIDNVRTAPVVFPLADFNWQSSRGVYDSRFSLDSNVMSLTRTEGVQSRRISNVAGWTLPYIASDGQVIKFNAQLRGDVYSVDSQPLANGNTYNGIVGRVLPQASVVWSLPFINQMENSSVLLEPVVMVAASPNSGNSSKIPNEDSQVPEFNTSNLFSPNRYSGFDRVETGLQASYGLRGQAQFYNDKYVDWLIGQHYYSDANNNFPFTNDINSHLSDYVGKIGINYNPFSIAYRFRLDKNSLAFNRNEIDATFTYSPVTLSASYLSLKNDPSLQNKQEISGGATFDLTREWKWAVAGRRDLELGQLTSASTSLIFHNECIDILNTLSKEYTQDRDIKPATTFLFRVSFKNLD